MLYAFIASLLFYIALVVVMRGKAPKSATELLTNAPVKWMPFSFAALQLSVAGVLAAWIAISDQFGYLTIITVVYIPLAYFILWQLIKKVRQNKGDNYLPARIHKLIANAGKPARFAAYNATAMILFHAFFLGWEVHIGSTIIGPMLFPEMAVNVAGYITAALILVTVAIYSTFSGYSSVVKTDLVQLGIALLVFVAVGSKLWLTNASLPSWEVAQTGVNVKDFIMLLILATVTNVCFHVQSPINWQMAEAAGKDYSKVIGKGLLIVAPLWILIMLMAIVHAGPSFPAMLQFNGGWQQLAVVLGVSAFLMSTADTILSGCLHNAHGVWKIYKKPDISKTGREARLGWFRILTPLLLVISAVTVMFLAATAPSLIQAIFNIGGCLAVFSPMYFLIAMGQDDFVRQRFAAPWKSDAIFAIFVTAITVQTWLFTKELGDWGLAVVLCTIFAGFMVGFVGKKVELRTSK